MSKQNFSFVNETGTSSRRLALRNIRSHIAKRQHEKRREQAREANKKGKKDLKRKYLHEDSETQSSSSISTPSEGSSGSSTSPDDEQTPKHVNVLVPWRHPVAKEQVLTHVQRPPSGQRSAQLALALNGLGPFALDPVPRKDWFAWLTDYWYKGTLPRSTRLLKTTDAKIQEYTIWSRRMEMSEPALYYMSLLLASGIPVANGSFPLGKALWLRGQTIRAMNEALSDPSRATSIGMIVAVGQMALHEHIYGDRSAAHRSHRIAQQKMIEIRGGIETLDLPPIVVQVMVWYDKLMASEAGNTAYFADLPQRMRQIHAYDEEEAIRVTNFSSPKRYNHPGYRVTEVQEEPYDDNESVYGG